MKKFEEFENPEQMEKIEEKKLNNWKISWKTKFPQFFYIAFCNLNFRAKNQYYKYF